ncbi:hypothetical protein E2C01_078119 [Portunus trituberculatus]|uniref:Uncharacterized protein n=1 Tax=Portunus trituberculatus TaxID=210409 RepID=A0A5B7IG63_PORTR|nr:hypothetical protein [Portunus trituberculatus]
MYRVVGPLPESDVNNHHLYRSSEDEDHAGLNFLTHPKIDRTDMNTVCEGGTKESEKDHIPLRNCADFFGKISGGMDEIPTPISIVRHNPTRRRDLADFRN